MAAKFITVSVIACAFCLAAATAGPTDDFRPKRDLDLSSIVSSLATQFFKNGGQTGVSELSNSAPEQKPNVLQKYLGGAAGAALMSAVMSNMGGGNRNNGGQGQGSQNTLANLATHPLVLQLIQMIMQKFGGGSGGNQRSNMPEQKAMQMAPTGGANDFGNNNNNGNYQNQGGLGGQKQKSGQSTGSAILMAIAKQMLKS